MTEFDAEFFAEMDNITEENPPLFLKNFPIYAEQIIQPLAKLKLSFYKAKALVMLRQYGEAEMIALDILRKAVAPKNYFLLVQANLILSKCYNKMNTRHRVKSCLITAEEHATAADDLELIAEVFSHFGIYYNDLGDDNAAFEYNMKAVTMAKAFKPSLVMANILTRFATYYHQHNQYDKVVEYLNQALYVSQQANIIFLQLRCINNLATAYTMMKNFAQAAELLDRGIEICKDRSYPLQMVELIFNLGVQNNYQGKYEKAIEFYDQCFALAQEHNLLSPPFLLDIYSNYGLCHWRLGHLEETIHYMNLAEEITDHAENPAFGIELRVNKTNILISMGQYDEAEKILHTAIKFYEKNTDFHALLVAYHNLALLYEKKKDFEQSIIVHQNIEEAYCQHLEQILNESSKFHTQQIKELTDKYDQINLNYNTLVKSYQDQATSSFIGQSEAHRKVLSSALLAAQHPNANVLILGEQGTGKKMVANIIHHNSVRRVAPFVLVHTTTVSPALLDSQLFGDLTNNAESESNKGVFRQAHKGSVYLDEITSVSNEIQVRLLRLMETKKVMPLGSAKAMTVDTRIISSSTRDVYDLIKANEFRVDLFHKLNTIEIYIPPLRSRPEDIEMLTYYFVNKYSLEFNRAKPQISNSFIDTLIKQPLPGNVRELKSIIEKIFLLTNTAVWDESLWGKFKH